jgi:hypothetical protein
VIACPNCGASLEWDGSYGTSLTCAYCNTVVRPAASVMGEVWLMTDPVARARYEEEGTLDRLEHDIRFEVMRGADWSAKDLQFVAETKRLLDKGAIRLLASFWAVSPHPPIYRALKSGEYRFRSGTVPFGEGDEIVWACPMTRDGLELDLPVLVGDLKDARIRRLCGDMVNAMMGRMS